MKLISIIWDVIMLILGGMDYDMAVNNASIKYNIKTGFIRMELKKQGYDRDLYYLPAHKLPKEYELKSN